jgi:uncharacterized membrane protein YgcG
MFKQIILATSVALMAASTTPAAARSGQAGAHSSRPSETPVDARVAALFAQYPNGGPDLVAALEGLLEQSPSLAVDVVAAARLGNLDQENAAGLALADAQAALAAAGDLKGANALREAAGRADPRTAAAYHAATGEVVVGESRGPGSQWSFGGVGSFGGGGGSVGALGSSVSPN